MRNAVEKIFRRWVLSADEIIFCKTARQSSLNVEPCIIVQMPSDYFCLCLFRVATSQMYANRKLLGLWPSNILSSPRHESFQDLKRIIRRIFNWIDYSRWRRLYRTLGVSSFFSLEVGIIDAARNWRVAHRLWRNLRSKEDLLALFLNGTPCGDLIYDTYLRFRVQPSVDVKDPYLRTLIAQALNAQVGIRKLLHGNKIEVLLTSNSCYVQHGVPVREALQAGVDVYSAGNFSQYFKRLSLEDTLSAAAYWRYKNQFDALVNPEGMKALAKEQLENRFQGALDRATSYMRTSAYASNDVQMPAGVEGVVFLHDFFDSPHIYRNMLFLDFWEWALFTLNVIEFENLPIAVKPHPNQLPESLLIVEQLKKIFPRVQWIDSKISNLTIFRSDIRCGISVYGTILHELAYQGIPALAAGDHPHVAFDIAKTPATVEEYRQCLINFRSIHLSENAKDEVLAFYYMHNIYDKEDLPIDFGQMNLRSLDPSSSVALPRFMEMLETQRKLDAAAAGEGSRV